MSSSQDHRPLLNLRSKLMFRLRPYFPSPAGAGGATGGRPQPGPPP